MFLGYQTIPSKQCLEQPSISLIIEVGKGKIYLGNLEAARNTAMLQKNNIKAVLTVCREAEVNFNRESGIEHLFIPINDRPDFNLQQSFDKTDSFIQKILGQELNILVHCFSGKSRSSAVVLAYLMRRQKMNLEQAMKLILSKRPMVDPNPGFIRQLLEFEKIIYGGISSCLNQNITQYYRVQDLPFYRPTIAAPQTKQITKTLNSSIYQQLPPQQNKNQRQQSQPLVLAINTDKNLKQAEKPIPQQQKTSQNFIPCRNITIAKIQSQSQTKQQAEQLIQKQKAYISERPTQYQNPRGISINPTQGNVLRESNLSYSSQINIPNFQPKMIKGSSRVVSPFSNTFTNGLFKRQMSTMDIRSRIESNLQ